MPETRIITSSAPQRIRIGTRGSPLALAQAHAVEAAITRLTGGEWGADIIAYTTMGDQLTTQRLTEAGGKGLFTREIDAAVDRGDVDLAVHSLKDVPSVLPDGQVFVAFPEREDPREAFLCDLASHPRDLPHGARVGTASLRRQAQTLAMRSDLEIVTFRGNVQTRRRKLADGEADATFLACAGLRRLGLMEAAAGIISLEDMLPAAGQGIVGVVAREGYLPDAVAAALTAHSDAATIRAATAERAFLARLDGSCRTPIAGHLFVSEAGVYRFCGEAFSEDGRRHFRAEATAGPDAGHETLQALGREVAERVLEQAGGQLPSLAAQG